MLEDHLARIALQREAFGEDSLEGYGFGVGDMQFLDLDGENHSRNNWVRGICQYGIMPANGFVYLPSHNCSCYPEAKLFGMWTLKSDESSIEVEISW